MEFQIKRLKSGQKVTILELSSGERKAAMGPDHPASPLTFNGQGVSYVNIMYDNFQGTDYIMRPTNCF